MAGDEVAERGGVAPDALGELGAALARSLKHGAPWQAHHAFDVLAILDMPSWASLLTLIAECPVIHGAMSPALPGVLAVDPADGAGLSWLYRHSEVLARDMREDGMLAVTVRADAKNAEIMRRKYSLA